MENPLEVLRTVSADRQYNSVDATGVLANPLDFAAGKVTFVNFDDLNEENRASILESHGK